MNVFNGSVGRAKRLAVAVLCTAGLVATIPATSGAVPAVTTASYVDRLHQDLLFRPPSANETTWWTAYLGGGGSRSTVVNSIIGSSEFKANWVVGTAVRYLDSVFVDDPALAALTATLVSNSDYLAVEVSILAGAQYYTEAGSTTSDFLDSLYPDVLDRAPDPGGKAYWTTQISNGTSRATVATSLLRSTESAGLRVRGSTSQTTCSSIVLEEHADILAGSYCLVLDRMADPAGATFWTAYLTGTGNQVTSLWANHAASSEYYNNS